MVSQSGSGMGVHVPTESPAELNLADEKEDQLMRLL